MKTLYRFLSKRCKEIETVKIWIFKEKCYRGLRMVRTHFLVQLQAPRKKTEMFSETTLNM